MASTIREVAREAGVSIATVSHALSGKRPVSGPARKRISVAIERLGYRPNRIAAAMTTGRTETLGMVVPDIANPFFGQLLGAAERAAAARGYTVIASSSELDAALEARCLAKLHDRRVDALLYLAGTDRPSPALAELEATGTPIVVLDEELPHLPASTSYLTVDNDRGGAAAAKHLLALGHRELGVVSGPRELPTARARLTGFRRGLARAGVDLPSSRLRYAHAYTHEGGRRAARDLLQRRPETTAVFCGNDLIALGALEAARELGLDVPGLLSLVGFDDIFFSSLVSPALTTIRQPLARLGREAAALAIDLIEGAVTGPVRRVLPVELVARASTAPPPVRLVRRSRTATARRK